MRFGMMFAAAAAALTCVMSAPAAAQRYIGFQIKGAAPLSGVETGDHYLETDTITVFFDLTSTVGKPDGLYAFTDPNQPYNMGYGGVVALGV